jgi:hypothetical protein
MKKVCLFFAIALCMGGVAQGKKGLPLKGLSYRAAKQIKDDLWEIELYFYRHRIPTSQELVGVISTRPAGLKQFSAEVIFNDLKNYLDSLSSNSKPSLLSFGNDIKGFGLLGGYVEAIKISVRQNNINNFDKYRNLIMDLITPTLDQGNWLTALKYYVFGSQKNTPAQKKTSKLDVSLEQRPLRGASQEQGYIAAAMSKVAGAASSFYRWLFPATWTHTEYSLKPNEAGEFVIVEKTTEM